MWAETDKDVLKKQQRKKEGEEKKLQEIQRRQQLKQLAVQEEQELEKKYGKPKESKITRAELQKQREIEALSQKKADEKAKKENDKIEENINRVIAEEKNLYGAENYIEARSVEDAVGSMSVLDDKADRHPEKRLKASYLAYEEKSLPLLREENPSLKLSQLKEMIWKSWQKAPENPLNQLR